MSEQHKILICPKPEESFDIPGSFRGKCSQCVCEVVISPSSNWALDQMLIYCNKCAMELVQEYGEDDEIVVLSGKNGPVTVNSCPKCGEKVDAATCVGDRELQPKVGDLSLCIYCTALLQYVGVEDGEFSYQEVGEGELDGGLRYELNRARQVIKEFKSRREQW